MRGVRGKSWEEIRGKGKDKMNYNAVGRVRDKEFMTEGGKKIEGDGKKGGVKDERNRG